MGLQGYCWTRKTREGLTTKKTWPLRTLKFVVRSQTLVESRVLPTRKGMVNETWNVFSPKNTHQLIISNWWLEEKLGRASFWGISLPRFPLEVGDWFFTSIPIGPIIFGIFTYIDRTNHLQINNSCRKIFTSPHGSYGIWIKRWKGPQPGEELKQLRLVKMKSKVGIMERVDKQESDSGKLWEVSWVLVF